MAAVDPCPNCGVDLNGDKIPYDMVQDYIPYVWSGNKDAWLAQNGWPTWKRKRGIEVRGAYDGILIWECPDCGHKWPRFPSGDPYWERLHNKAVDIIKSWETRGKDRQPAKSA